MLTDAIRKRASDIHIEPFERMLRVRFRIDGVLYEIMKPPLKLKNPLISRLKIMASLDIAERRLPQDGRIKLRLPGSKEMDFRVSVIPTIFGEKIVLRLLDKSSLQLDMTKLGFEDAALRDFKEAISRPHGMVLVTGPTGSGKTTTLYSALSELNRITDNISTVEDPVEYNLVGINQVQIHDDIGFSFAAALRSFLRQDPDVIMVGEIRDFETAEIAVKAALTGHLVLSTLHTNDAPSTINRLLNMGVEPFLVSSSLNLILAQRLARVICPRCKTETEYPREALLRGRLPARGPRRGEILSRDGLRRVQRDRIQRPDRALRGAADAGGDLRSGAGRSLRRGDQAQIRVARHADAAGRRPSQGARGDHDGRRGSPRHRFGLNGRLMYTSGRTRSEGAAPWRTSKNF